jgi:hypothetical protein
MSGVKTKAETNHIKSKARVRDQGEVFTAEREVNAMLDLVKNETERIESRFLEPACGDGNFLAPILERKLAVVERRYKKSQTEYEVNALIAIGSIYGVDIMKDNVQDCRTRLFGMFDEHYTRLYKKKTKDSIRNSIKAILKQNIVHGNALTYTTEGDHPKPLVFSEWVRPRHNGYIKRQDWQYEEIVTKDDPSLFKESIIRQEDGKPVFRVRPVKTYPSVHMTKLGETS